MIYYKLIFLFLSLVSVVRLPGQCPEGLKATFIRQGQIDSFSFYYPGCTKVKDLTIYTQDGNIFNLDSLYYLKGPQGSISILGNYNDQFTLKGLHNIDSISYLGISNHNHLLGLENIRYIHYLYFQSNNTIDLSALKSITSIETLDFNVFQPSAVITLDKVPDIPYVKNFAILGNILPDSIANIKRIDRLSIRQNNVLRHLKTLSDRTYLETLLWNGSGTDISFDGMEKITNLDVLIMSNINKVSNMNGLKNINQISGLSMSNIKAYSPMDLSDLAAIQNIGYLSLIDVTGLKSLYGFPASDTLYEIILKKNKSLTDVGALEKVKNVIYRDHPGFSETGVQISDNALLTECSVNPICEMLKTYPENVKIISNNGQECQNIPQVISLCTTSSSENNEPTTLKIYPNPAYSEIYIDPPVQDFEIKDACVKSVQVVNNQSGNIDISFLKPGIYFIYFKSNHQKIPQVKRFIKI